MKTHYQFSDTEFEMQFADASLPPHLFTHEAHLRLAWIHINSYEQTVAIEQISSQILKFATRHGDPNKFDATVTVAAIKIVHHFIQKSKTIYFKDFIKEFPGLKYNFKEILDQHYGFDIFDSEKAKKEYIQPDLYPFNP